MPRRRVEQEPVRPGGAVRINMKAAEEQWADEQAWREYLRDLDPARWGLYGPIEDDE